VFQGGAAAREGESCDKREDERRAAIHG
jgi:hypothetical protein